MTDNEKRNASAKSSPPSEIKNTENLLNEFGASGKRSSASTSPQTTATVKNAETGTDENTADSAPKKQNNGSANSDTAKKDKPSTQKKSASGAASAKSNSKKGTDKQKDTQDNVRASTASPKKDTGRTAEKKKNDNTIDLDNRPRSSRPAHRVMPYVLIILAIFVGVSLILNLICNQGNHLADNPSAHWMGVAGYYICYALFGLFGPAVYVLPLLLLNLGFFWKQYIDRRVTISKIVASVIFLLILGAVIHVIVFVLAPIPVDRRDMSVADLMYYGAQMTGGGVLGGKLGYFFYYYLNVVGTLIIGICLLAASLFYFLGMTPQHLWDHFRMRRALRSERIPTVSEQDAEAARNKAAMDEKIRKVTSRQLTVNDADETDGAVKIVEPAPSKRSEEDKLAPMPLPRLDPNDGSRPFVPVDVGRKLNEAKKADAETASPAQAQKPVAAPSTAAPSAQATAPATPAAPVPNPAQNRDTAAESVFPRTSDTKQVRKIPKEDRNFDLRNYFIDLDESERVQQRKHAPVPPEVPLTGSRPAAKPTATAPTGASAQPVRPETPANGAKPTVRPATAPSAGAPVKAPSLSAVKPAPVQKDSAEPKPVFRPAAKTMQKEYGLSSEEFEQLESKNAPLPKTGTKAPVKEGAKDSTAKAPSSTAKESGKPTPTPKTDVSKKYVFPPISYLHPGEPMTEENRAEIQASMNQLAETLASFHVKVKEINYSCGPTVTRYEVILAPGVRVRTVTNLADDIALALRSSGGVRIEAPIPGTNAVGIEVPNKTRSTIYLRDLIESKVFAESKSKLSACLGADIAGAPLIFDIAKMPHLLIAGTTGSGKSVCINCIIMSLLYKVRPDEVKLVLIDPKKVEFSIYKNIPHLMAPVVTQPKDAAGALQAAVEEMERRFEVFESVGVRDLKGYNEITANDPDMPYIPHIVIIIDELADLMMTAKNEVETAICRIAQKARAAGMHLIIGTQRPSADVVTGLIKANVPSSIAFAVKSQIDSRVILDHGGAEALTGRGDMLFVPIGSMRDTRVQGAFVDDKEVEKICEFIRATNGTAQYDEKFISKLKELAAQCGNKGKAGGGDDALPSGSDEKGDDPKYADAVRVAVEEKRISTSLLQRKLEVGYSRAAKLIDRMQSEGIVSPPDGSKPRTILISAEEYLKRFVDGQGE